MTTKKAEINAQESLIQYDRTASREALSGSRFGAPQERLGGHEAKEQCVGWTTGETFEVGTRVAKTKR